MSGDQVEPRQSLVGRCRVSLACHRGEEHEGLCASRVVTPPATVALVFTEEELLGFAKWSESAGSPPEMADLELAKAVEDRLVEAAKAVVFGSGSRAARAGVQR